MNIVNRTFWEILAQAGKPVILYGMGSGADKIIDYCAAKNIKIDDMFASDQYVREHSFRGFKVKSLSQVQAMYGDFCVLLAFGSRIDSVMQKIHALAGKHELYVPNFPVFGGGYFDYDYYLANKAQVEQAYDLLADGESKRVYECAVNFNITGRLEYLSAMESAKHDALDLLGLRGDLSYIDLGAYDGDTVFELMEYGRRAFNISKIYAFEPDMKNFNKLRRRLGERGLEHICELYNLGAWSCEGSLGFNAQGSRHSNFDGLPGAQRVDSVDNLLAGKISGQVLIKYDVEGAELEALAGSRELIRKYSPKLIVSLYHRIDDIFKIPVYISSLNAGYRLYLRKHKYIPCWDLNLYAVES